MSTCRIPGIRKKSEAINICVPERLSRILYSTMVLSDLESRNAPSDPVGVDLVFVPFQAFFVPFGQSVRRRQQPASDSWDSHQEEHQDQANAK
jgi:hypothetical protein